MAVRIVRQHSESLGYYLKYCRSSRHSPVSFKENMSTHYSKYAPLEIDQAIKFDAKHKLMQEWYTKVSQEFKSAKFSTELTNKILNEANIAVRHLFEEFFI